ncbi:MAG: C25 family cysteine peptidase, partial [Bacteroidota bacterium]
MLKTAGGIDYGNEWYVPSQSYVKFRVFEDGIYRVTAPELANAGFPINLNFTNLQLFYRGKEQHIHVEINGGNLQYVEFYGERNDGGDDSIMYRHPYSAVHDPSQQPNEHLSLFTDTSAYWLTYGPNPGLRYQNFNDQNYQNYPAEPHFRYRSYHEYHPSQGGPVSVWNHGGGSQYDIFHILNSSYITGEGYVGRGFDPVNYAGVTIPTPAAANVGNPSDVKVRVYGRSSWRHVLRIDLDGTPVNQDTVDGVYVRTRNISYNGVLGNDLDLIMRAFGTQNNNTDNNNYCWSSIDYDRFFDLDGEGKIRMINWNDAQNAHFRFTNGAVNGGSAIAYDLTTQTRCIGRAGNDTVQVVVPGNATARTIFVSTDSAIGSPVIEPHRLSNLKSSQNDADFIIITHRSLASSATEYKRYRDTCTVNPHTARVVYTDEIYDEFGYGSITPLAIKRFCKYAIENWATRPGYFLLWGKGQYIIRDYPLNLVPTYGYPACDYDYVSDYDPYDVNVTPEAAIGRVNVYNNAEGMIYLAKTNEYEHTQWEQWMKEVVFLGGGNDTTEQRPILDFLRDQYMPWVEALPLGGSGNYYQKYNTGEITNSPFTATQRVNNGVSVIHFFGHSSNNIYDVDIQEPVLYQNYGMYPMMFAFGCYGGNFTSGGKSFGERFVLEEGRGSINYIANSTAGYLTPLGN